MIEPDISTPEAENPPEQRAESGIGWRMGPLTCLAILVVGVVDLFQVYPWNGYTESYETMRFGIRFGLAGVLAVWATSIRVRHRFLALLGAVAGAAIISLYDMYWEDDDGSSSEMAGYALLFITYSVAAISGIYAWRWTQLLWARRNNATHETWVPRFNVTRLLLLMVAIAVLALIIRTALPNLGEFMDGSTIIILATWAIAPIAAGVLLLDRPPSLWRLALFAAIGLASGWIGAQFSEWPSHLPTEAVQMAVLAILIVGPQLDRYSMKITFEPRNDGAKSQADHLTE